MTISAPLFPLRLKKGVEAAVLEGMPWIYANEIVDSSELLPAPPGALVAIETMRGKRIATGYYNAKSQIACRVLTLENEAINEHFFLMRLERAKAKRNRLIGIPYYRLAHSEADGLPGLLIDRFGDAAVAQTGTAGMDALQSLWLGALKQCLKPQTIILRNDIASRTLEGLRQETVVIEGACEDTAEVHENGCVYFADLLKGQKTGWFYDQRDNRKMIAEMAKGKTLLDVYSHSGGFSILAAKAGAEVTLADSSKSALDLARRAAAHNRVTCSYVQGDAFEIMAKLAKEKKQFDIVLADPPAFVKAKKDFVSGMKGYGKMARLAAPLVKSGGYLLATSCSHHASRGAFTKAILQGVEKSGRVGAVLRQTGAAADHPVYPKLPQNEYLKGVLLAI